MLALISTNLKAQIKISVQQSAQSGILSEAGQAVYTSPATLEANTPSPNFDWQEPAYVQQNPRGYSPLCRLELKLEDKLPFAPWIKLNPTNFNPAEYRGNATFQLKIKKF